MPSVCSSVEWALRLCVSAFVLLTPAGPITAVRAESVPLTDAAIKDAVSGATVHLGTPLGIALPLTFHADGTVTGTAGRLAFYLGSVSDRGRWWVANAKLCQKWSRWFDSQARCIQISQEGARFHWSSDDGKSGTAQIVARAPAPTVQPAKEPAPGVSRPLQGNLPADKPITVPKPVLLVERSVVAPSPDSSAVHRTAAPKLDVSRFPATKLLAGNRSAKLSRYRMVGVRSGDALNVRELPSAQSRLVGSIPTGTPDLTVVGSCLRAWCRVRFGALEGWANAAFLEPST